jgi:hypothetical protein
MSRSTIMVDEDLRVDFCLPPVGDGLTLLRLR